MLKRLERWGKVAFAKTLSHCLRTGRIHPEELDRMRIERLLVIRQHNQMGDMLLAVPAFRGIRKRFPRARITLLAAPINTDVMRNNPYVDEVLVYTKEQNRQCLTRLFDFIAALRRRRFDAVIVLNTVSFSITSMLLGAVCGAPVRIGSTSLSFGHDLSARFYSLELPLPDEAALAHMHESEHNLYPLAAIGVDEGDLSSILVPTREEELDCANFVQTAVPEGDRFIVVHPGAGKKQNIWPPRNFAAVVRELRARFGLRAVAVRGPVDGEVFDEFLRTSVPLPAVLSCPSVGFLGALMNRAALTLCNDTGTMHIAGAVGARCIAVFGPTDPARWKPACDYVCAVRAPDGRVTSVTVDEVLSRAVSLVTASISERA